MNQLRSDILGRARFGTVLGRGTAILERARVRLLLVLTAVVLLTPEARGAQVDPAARGLDLLVHLPTKATSEATLPVQLLAYGFSAVDRPAPLAHAKVEAVWNPESLGVDLAKAPAPVRTETDGAGRARMDVPVPPGPAHELSLLVRVSYGEHERTRSVTVQRRGPTEVTLQVAERRVVPGSTITAWVMVHSAATGRPIPRAPVDLSLLEGGVARFTTRLRTDAAGSAVGRVPIPRAGSARWSWKLQAREPGRSSKDAAKDELVLSVRDETPGTPRLDARCDELAIRAGESVDCTLRLRDASDGPVAGHALRTWWGPRGTKPPTDPKGWEKASTPVTTDSTGRAKITLRAPSTVPPVVGTELELIVRSRFDGRDLDANERVQVRESIPRVSFLPDGGAMVGGVQQHALLRVRDERNKPVSARFRVQADGLDAEVETDVHGEADVLWRVPKDVGAYRGVGPCAGEVATAVRVSALGDVAAFGSSRAPRELCVSVDRDAPAIVHLSPLVVTAGGRVHVTVEPGHRPWSVVARAVEGDMAASAWLADGAEGADITIPTGASGTWSVTAVSPGIRRPSDVVTASLLVVPDVLPRVEARLAGGRIVPGGVALVDVQLTDAAGKGITGTVAALVHDRFGGGSLEGLYRLDARRRLCSPFDIERTRCDALLEGDGSVDPLRRGLLGQARSAEVGPVLDPAATVDEDLREAFREVVHSLEGAVLEATASPERLRDARRKGPGGRWSFNPELWTLVTAAMDEPPETPGGEPFGLRDLVALDEQVSFDNVARRVTRLKIFRALAAVRNHIRSRELGPDEPALRDPAALLRRLVRSGQLAESDLLDPWGGTLAFVAGGRDGLPFLTMRGFELRSPGPDGRLGNGDDVRDPFERVLRSKTPYAEAVGEDELCDARLDMQVADATVEAWQELIERLTGTSLGGRGEGIGLGSIGTVGHGAGTGTGSGFGSGHGRLGRSISLSGARWVLPIRTDSSGRARIEVPIGDDETTWRIGVVGLADVGEGAVTMLDVPVSLPLSARVETGGAWVERDEAEVRVSVRNRTDAGVNAELALEPKGAIALARTVDARRTLAVPARGSAEVLVPVRAVRAGNAELAVRTRAAGVAEDFYRHQWEVVPRGEPTDVVQMAWVDAEAEISLPPARPGEPWLAPPKLIVMQGHRPLLAAALEALEPDLLTTPDALANALAAAVAIRRLVLATDGEQSPLVRRSLDVGRRALGRLAVHSADRHGPAAWRQLALADPPSGSKDVVGTMRANLAQCPPDEAEDLPEALSWLEVETPSASGASRACWDELVSRTVDRVTSRGDAEQLALAVLGLSRSPHRKAVAASLAARLAHDVGLTKGGWLSMPASSSAQRSTRAIVYAALVTAAAKGAPLAATADQLLSWLALQADSRGGFGSARATRAVVEALAALSSPAPAAVGATPLVEATATAAGTSTAPSAIRVTEGEAERAVALGPDGRGILVLAPETTRVVVRSEGPPVVVRMERRKLRPWSRLPTSGAPPFRVDFDWPVPPRVEESCPLRITLLNQLDRDETVEVRLPLPAGAKLAAPVSGAREAQGVLSLTRSLDATGVPVVIDVPIRFGHRGSLTVPEAHATLVDEEAERVVVPARPITVR